MHDTTRILLYALVAGLSPLALLATLAVLGSGRGRLNGLAFAVGFLLTQTTVLVLAILLGSAATPNRERGHPTLAAALEIALGVLLLLFAARGRVGDGPQESREESRTKAILARLSHLRPVTAFSAGALLGVGGVKRLTITLFTGATIAISGLIPAEQAGLAVLYIAIASVLVWLPVAVYLVAGSRADAWTERTQGWIIANEQRITALSMAVFGLLLIGHALVLLL